MTGVLRRPLAKKLFAIGTLLTGVMIILDAFGAHGLKAIWDEAQIANYKTAVKYIGLLAAGYYVCGAAHALFNIRPRYIISLWTGGTILFSGSIILLTMKSYVPKSLIAVLGPITPIGGTLIIIGWLLLCYQLLSTRAEEE